MKKAIAIIIIIAFAAQLAGCRANNEPAENISENAADKMEEYSVEMTRKERSEEFLCTEGIKINPYLPEIMTEEEAKIKSPEEAVRRAVCAFLAAGIAIDIMNGETGVESAKFFTQLLNRFDLENYLTADEKRYFAKAGENPPEITVQEANDMQWRMEMCMTIFWAYGFLGDDDLPFPSEITDTTDMVNLIGSCNDFDELMTHVRMHSASEILDHADMCYRMDWACVEARIKNDPTICGELMSDVVTEQHKGYCWLIGAEGAEDWDNVIAHT